VAVTVYECRRALRALAYEALWPSVRGQQPVRVVVRDPEGRMRDAYLFTTDLQAAIGWMVPRLAWRWAIEVLFRASKQVLDIEAPQHYAQASVEKVAPWVWSMQSVIMVWYLTAGRDVPEAEDWREVMGEWDSEWSLRQMVQVLRRATLNATMTPMSGEPTELLKRIETLKHCANLPAWAAGFLRKPSHCGQGKQGAYVGRDDWSRSAFVPDERSPWTVDLEQ
jgi:hypothetical protein